MCVMTTGQEWQFKPYKWKEPKELFHHGMHLSMSLMTARITDLNLSHAVKGVYPQWTSDPPNAKIRSWNVNELRVSTSGPRLPVMTTLLTCLHFRSTGASGTSTSRRLPISGDSSRDGSRATSRGSRSEAAVGKGGLVYTI